MADRPALPSRGAALLVALLALVPSGAVNATASAVVVRDAWSRPANTTGVVYLTIRNRGGRADRLVAATCDIARRVEFHESSSAATAMDSMAGMAMPGGAMVSMRRLAFIDVPAHAARALRPGGDHLMLVGLRRGLRAGMRFRLRLRFARAGWQEADVPVRDT